MNESIPKVVVLAGPNGAGKTTAAQKLLHDLAGLQHFVNADWIARGLSGFNPDAAAIDAGRVMLARLRQLAASRASFAFETTLASRTFAPWIEGLCKSGYRFALTFYGFRPPTMHWPESPTECVEAATLFPMKRCAADTRRVCVTSLTSTNRWRQDGVFTTIRSLPSRD